ncbi:MAG: retropepsin-like aspartic protease, partial [Tannerellaceae bacterium]
MKLFLLMLFIVLSVGVRSQSPDFKVMHNLTAENYFKALDLFNHYQDSMSDKNRLMAHTFLYSYFFQPEKAILTADTLFMRYKSSLNNTLYIVFATLTAENYAYVQDYAKAEAIMSELTNPEGYIMSHAARESYEALQIQYAALKNNPPLQIVRPDQATTLPLMGATRTHLRIPVRINHQTKIMMLDTGAARNVITQKEAKALNARIISEPVIISGYGGRVKGQLAMIEELVLG